MRSRLGLPERQMKMLMKIRSAQLYFLGNLICFSCTTVSLTPVFQGLGHHKLYFSSGINMGPVRLGVPRLCCACKESTGSV